MDLAKLLPIVVLVVLGLTGCDSAEQSRKSPYIELEVWLPAGKDAESLKIQQQVTRYNNAQYLNRVNAVILPEAGYRVLMEDTAARGTLPDILMMDARLLYRLAAQGDLVPIDKYLTDNTREDLLPSVLAQGMYRGRVYGIATQETGVALFAKRSRLQDARADTSDIAGEDWGLEQFERLLFVLAESAAGRPVLDLNLGRDDDWYMLAFSAIISSGGGDLVDNSDHHTALGHLNHPGAVNAMRRVQTWAKRGWVNSRTDIDTFMDGNAAMAWGDHRDYQRYRARFGDDILVLPLPDFGRGSLTGQGTWALGISNDCRNPRAAMHFIEYLLQPKQILEMSSASGAIPATFSALKRSSLYQPGGPLDLLARKVTSKAVLRPQTEAYPVIASAFRSAWDRILKGEDPQEALDSAARSIDTFLKNHVVD